MTDAAKPEVRQRSTIADVAEPEYETIVLASPSKLLHYCLRRNHLLIVPAMHITQFLHAAILVSDLEKSEHFYGTILGLVKVDRVLKFPGAWYQINDFQIHLIADAAAQSDVQNSEKWGRNRHLAFSIADLNAAKDQLLSYGCEFQMSASGRSALFVQDPDGTVIELGER